MDLHPAERTMTLQMLHTQQGAFQRHKEGGPSMAISSHPSCFACDRDGKDRSSRKLLFCKRCHAIQYCCTQCQSEHFPRHRRLCRGIHRVRTVSENFSNTLQLKADARQIHFTAYLFAHAEDFEIWLEHRIQLIGGLLAVATHASYREAHKLVMEPRELGHMEVPGTPGVKIKLQISLGFEQSAFDFCNAWSRAGDQVSRISSLSPFRPVTYDVPAIGWVSEPDMYRHKILMEDPLSFASMTSHRRTS